jgi:hypothetical protein
MALVEEVVPLLFLMTRVPQKANEVLVEPVLLFIVKFNVLYTESPGVQVLQRSVPGKVAPTRVRSFEVQEVAGGNVVVVCAKACDENNRKSTAVNRGDVFFNPSVTGLHLRQRGGAMSR